MDVIVRLSQGWSRSTWVITRDEERCTQVVDTAGLPAHVSRPRAVLEPLTQTERLWAQRIVGETGSVADIAARYAEKPEYVRQVLSSVYAKAGCTDRFKRPELLRMYHEVPMVRTWIRGDAPRQDAAGDAESMRLSHQPDVVSHQPDLVSIYLPGPQRFVGRAAELGHVVATITRGFEEWRGSITLVTGEAGFGKSTLAGEAARTLRRTVPNLRTCLGRGVSSVADFGLFQQVFQQLLDEPASSNDDSGSAEPIDIVVDTLLRLGIRSIDEASGFAGLASGLLSRRLSAAAPPESRLHVLSEPMNRLDCYASALRRISQTLPLLLVLDDLHTADEASLRLLLHLARMAPESRVAVIATSRSHSSESPLLTQIQNALLGAGAERIDLETGLAPHSFAAGRAQPDSRHSRDLAFTTEYLRAYFGDQVADVLGHDVARITSGNALFLAETMQNLVERGELRREAGEWRVMRGRVRLALPQRITAVIGERLGRLDAQLREIIRCASVEGNAFSVEVIASALGANASDVLRLLIDQVMREHGLVREDRTVVLPSGQRTHVFQFAHSLVRQYVLEHLVSRFERQEFHLRLANSTEALWEGRIDEVTPKLAEHYSGAGVPTKTFFYALIASERLSRFQSWRDVVRYTRLGLQALDVADLSTSIPLRDVIRLKLLLARAELEGGSGRPRDHIQIGLDVLMPCVSDLDSVGADLAAEVNLTVGQLSLAKGLSDNPANNGFLRRALELYEELNNPSGMILALSPVMLYSNPADQAVGSALLERRQRSLGIAMRQKDPELLAKTYRDLAEHLVSFDTPEPDPLVKAEQHARQALAQSKIRGSPVSEMYSRLVLGWVLHHQGRFGPELENHRRALVDDARRWSQVQLEAEALTDLGHYWSYIVGKQGQAEPLMMEGCELRRDLGLHMVNDREHLATHFMRTGAWSRAQSYLEELVTELAERGPDRAARAAAQLGNALYASGDKQKAERYLNLAAEQEGSRLTAASPFIMLGWARLGLARQAITQATRISTSDILSPAQRRGVFHTYCDYPTLMAETFLRCGDLKQARVWVDKGARVWQELSDITDIDQLIMYWEHVWVWVQTYQQCEPEVAAARLPLMEAALKRHGHWLIGRTIAP